MKAKEHALLALDRMAAIVRSEMLVKGTYMTEHKLKTIDSGPPLCRGRGFCAIGSLYVASGVKIQKAYGDNWYLPGVEESERADFMRTRPGLRLAYEALNEEAKEFMREHKMYGRWTWDAPIEALFEDHYGDRLRRHDLLNIVRKARKRVLES